MVCNITHGRCLAQLTDRVNFERGSLVHALPHTGLSLWKYSPFVSAPQGNMSCLQSRPKLSRSEELLRYAKSQEEIQMNLKLLGMLHCKYFKDLLVTDVTHPGSNYMLCCHRSQLVLLCKAVQLCMVKGF